jgi:hypothetical protein
MAALAADLGVIQALTMTYRLHGRPTRLLALLVFFASPAAARDWRDLRPAATSEKEVLDWFGPPTVAVATFPWAEWSAKWKKRPQTASYRLRYEVGSSSSPLLVGPGGRAEDVEVTIANGKVVSVWWRYGGPSARSAAARLRETPEFSFRTRELGTTGSRDVEGGWLKADIEERDTVVEITLQLK